MEELLFLEGPALKFAAASHSQHRCINLWSVPVSIPANFSEYIYLYHSES